MTAHSSKTKRTVLAGFSTLAISTFVLAACSSSSSSTPDSPDRGCTQEAKLCPDGSAVGREGPNCEFAPCPSATPPGGGKVCTRDAKLCPDGSSVGRTGPNCEFAPCPGGETATCKNNCGNGTCEEMVCQAVGCPCSESKSTCPQDCK